jgi:hypothetical protein
MLESEFDVSASQLSESCVPLSHESLSVSAWLSVSSTSETVALRIDELARSEPRLSLPANMRRIRLSAIRRTSFSVGKKDFSSLWDSGSRFSRWPRTGGGVVCTHSASLSSQRTTISWSWFKTGLMARTSMGDD